MKKLFASLLLSLVLFCSNFIAPAYAFEPSVTAIANGTIKIVDDETLLGDEEGFIQISETKEFKKNQKENFINVSKCVGDEVVVDIIIDGEYRQIDGSLKLTGKAIMNEGTSCDTQDFAGSQRINQNAMPYELSTISIELGNFELSGDDSAAGDITVLVYE